MKRREMPNGSDAADDPKKPRSANWNQIDTDLLCNLVREIGLKSVLNCRTNGTTNEIKKADWLSIAERFNSHPSVATQRNVDAIIARYKKVMQVMRNHFALERSNATQTGGGSSCVPKIELTGAMLELRSYYGHLLSGLPSYDSDKLPLNLNAYDSNPDSSILGKSILEQNSSCQSEVSMPTLVKSSSVTISPPIPLVEPIQISDSNASDQLQPKQYFATSAQRRRRLEPTETLEEKRRQLIDGERKRLSEFGELRLRSYQEENAARMEEILERKSLNLTLYQKQMEFWNIAIQRIQGSEHPVGIASEQTLPVGTIISVANSDVQSLASQVSKVIVEKPSAFESIGIEELDDNENANTTNYN